MEILLPAGSGIMTGCSLPGSDIVVYCMSEQLNIDKTHHVA